MKVKELIEKLKQFDGNMEVHYDFDFGYSTCPVDDIIVSGQGYRLSEEPKVVLLIDKYGE